MKKIFYTVLGILIILSILCVWGYLFVYGTPKSSEEVFAKFGIGGENVIRPVVIENTVVDVENTVVGGSSVQKLKQLTTRPVAGAVFASTSIMYVEQGTGHIYTIDYTNGNETLLSGTTIQKTMSAVFSTNGKHAGLTTFDGDGSKTFVGTVPRSGDISGFTGVELPQGARDVTFSTTPEIIFYYLKGTTGSIGYSYNIVTKKSTQLFHIPLRDIHVLWEPSLYVYTTPTAYQEGYIYRVVKNDLLYETSGGFGLMGFTSKDGLVVTEINENKILSSYVVTTGGKNQSLPLSLVPNKCVATNRTVFCAVPTTDPNGRTFPDDWYMGTISMADSLWEVDTTTGSVRSLSNLKKESGREIDVLKIGANAVGTHVYLINKNDNALWLFDTTL